MSTSPSSDAVRYLFSSGAEALRGIPLHVARFSGTEGLNRLFSFTISLVSPRPDVDTGALLEAPATFSILREDAPPATFSGYPARVEQGGTFHGYTYYTVELRPTFWKCTQIRQSRIFLDKNLQATLRELLTEQEYFSFAHRFTFMRADYPVPEFAMQHNESVYDYICWRLEDQGAYFYFDGDTIVFADHPQSHGDVPDTAPLRYAPLSNLEGAHVPEVITDFRLTQTPLPRRVAIRSYDWKEPSRIITGFADVSKTGLGDVYLPHEAVFTDADAARLAQIRAEELQCHARMFHGSSAAPTLRPGFVFTLGNHPSPRFNTRYLVTEVTHEGAQETFLNMGLGIVLRDGDDHLFYRNSFSCIEAERPYRPARTAPRATVEGAIHAFIDGAGSGARPELDSYGRYKVIFPFDISGRTAGRASCWVRMAQPQVGRHSGMCMPLRPGVEVLVTFIDGNPDLPVITGALPNGETGSLTASGNPDFSGIRTAGGNQISFGDADKHQSMDFRTPDGHGFTMGAGSLPAMMTNTGTALTSVEQGAATIATYGLSNLSSYQATLAAVPATGFLLVTQLVKTLLATFSATADPVLKNATDDSTKKGLQGSIGTAKMLVSMLDLLNNATKSIKSNQGLLPYGAILTASKDASKTIMRVQPDPKFFWLNTILPIVAGDMTRLGTRLAATSPQMQEQQRRETYQSAWKLAREALKNARAALSDISVGDLPAEVNEPACADYLPLNTAISAQIKKFTEEYGKEGTSDSTKTQIGVQKAKLDTAQASLTSTYAAYCDKGLDCELSKYRQQSSGETFYAYATSGFTDLIAEIVYNGIVFSYLCFGKSKKLGGIILSAADANINMVSRDPISAQSETGVIVNTLTTDASYKRQKASENLYTAYGGAPVDKGTRNFIGAPKLSETTLPENFTNRNFLVGDQELSNNNAFLTPQDAARTQQEAAAGAAPQVEAVAPAEGNEQAHNKTTYIAHITDVHYSAAQHGYAEMTQDNIVKAARHVLYTTEKSSRIAMHDKTLAGSPDANMEPVDAAISMISGLAADDNRNILLKIFEKGAESRTEFSLEKKKATLSTQESAQKNSRFELQPASAMLEAKNGDKTCHLSVKDSGLELVGKGTVAIADDGCISAIPANGKSVTICNFTIKNNEISGENNITIKAGKIQIG